MHPYRVQGVVIKRSNYAEADRLITLFTLEKGKITLRAKGVRRISSRRQGLVELFQTIKASVIPGKGGLDLLGEAELQTPTQPWRHLLGRVSVAYELSETIDRLVPEQVVMPEVYVFYKNCLEQISTLSNDWRHQVDLWQVNLLELLGFWPVGQTFDHDVHLYLEKIINRPLNSPRLLKKLSGSVK